MGIQYDEILFGNVSLGNIDNSFVIFKIKNIPILLMQYIGALKAYIYYPIFKLFGVSVLSIRLPMIILTSVSLYLLSEILKKIFNKKISLLVILLLVLDSSFISQVRYDVGPVSIEFFLKIFSLYFLFNFLKNKKNINVLFLGVILFLGIFNKLNFIWFVNSLLFSVVIFYGKDIINFYKNISIKMKRYFIIEISIIILSCYGYFFIINKIFNLFNPSSFNFKGKIIILTHNIYELIIGTNFYNYAIGDLRSYFNDIYIIFILVLIFISFILLLKKIFSFKKEYFFFLLLTVLILGQIFLTKEATAPWHVYSLYPFVVIIIVLSIVFLGKLINSKILRSLFLILLFSLIVFQHIFITSKYLTSYSDEPNNIFWSNKIYDLINYTAGSSRKFISLDWGIHNQLLTFSGDGDKYKEMFWWLNDGNNQTKEKKKWFYESFVKSKEYEFILHSEDYTKFMDARIRFFKLIEEYDNKLILSKTIGNKDKIIYEIYKLE